MAVSRPGELYDQDHEGSGPGPARAPERGRRGGFYDQDAGDDHRAAPSAARRPPETQRHGAGEADLRRRLEGERRRDRDLERRREREIELRRDAERAREQEARRRRARDAPPLPTSAPILISSRPAPPPGRQPAAGRQAPAGRPPPAGRLPAASQMQTATATLAAGTLVSRLTGFLRVLAIGYVLGVSPLSDAYNYANGIPNIVYDLLLGGVLSATLIPVFVEQLARPDEEDRGRGLSAVLSAITAALAVMSALLWALAPWVIRFYLVLAPRSTGHVERALATELLRYFAPQVFFLGALVTSTALLNTRRRFAAAAFSPVVNNLVAIAALLVTKVIASHLLTASSVSSAATLQRFSHDEHAIWVLGIGTTAGYVVQFLVQLPAMRRLGIRLRPAWEPGHPAVRRVARLSSWLAGVVLANQASLALVMVLAGKTSGGVTAYQFSYQFFQLPYGLIAVSVASALMPDLAERWTAGDRAGFERRFATGLRVTLAVLIPVAVMYAAVAQPFIQLAVHHGAVKASGAHLVSRSLALFAVGLPGFSAFFLLMRVYQAIQDTRSMFWVYALENALTVVAALALEPVLGVPGLALAWVAPYTVASAVAAVDLRRRVGSLGGSATVRSIVRVLLASALTLGVVAAAGAPFRAGGGDAALLARLVAQLGAGALAYLALAKAMHIRELRPIIRLGRRMLRRYAS